LLPIVCSNTSSSSSVSQSRSEDEVEEESEEEVDDSEEEEVEDTESDVSDEETEDEDEVFEHTIGNKLYYVEDDKNSPVYEYLEDGEVGEEIGYIKNGKLFLN